LAAAGCARIALDVAFYGGGLLTLAFLGRFLVELASAKFRQYAGFLAGALESAQSAVKMFTFSNTYAGHILISNTNLAALTAKEPAMIPTENPDCKVL
jgi:hypothetical protein